MPEFVGRGLGFFFLHQATQLAWSKPIERFLVNTCTLDHRRALPLYQRALSILEKRLGVRQPLTQKARMNYAEFLHSIGRDAEAAALEVNDEPSV